MRICRRRREGEATKRSEASCLGYVPPHTGAQDRGQPRKRARSSTRGSDSLRKRLMLQHRRYSVDTFVRTPREGQLVGGRCGTTRFVRARLVGSPKTATGVLRGRTCPRMTALFSFFCLVFACAYLAHHPRGLSLCCAGSAGGSLAVGCGSFLYDLSRNRRGMRVQKP